MQKFPNLFVLEETGTEIDSPVLRAYGLVCATHSTKLRSRSEEEQLLLRNVMQRMSHVQRKK